MCDFESRRRSSNILRHLIQDSGAPVIHLTITVAKAIFLSSVDRLREKQRAFLSAGSVRCGFYRSIRHVDRQPRR